MLKEQQNRYYFKNIKRMMIYNIVPMLILLQQYQTNEAVECFVMLPNKVGVSGNGNLFKKTQHKQLPLLSTTTNNGEKKIVKKNLPESEMINRRKSPVLWRDDHSLDVQQQPLPSIETKSDHYDYSKLTSPPEVMVRFISSLYKI